MFNYEHLNLKLRYKDGLTIKNIIMLSVMIVVRYYKK